MNGSCLVLISLRNSFNKTATQLTLKVMRNGFTTNFFLPALLPVLCLLPIWEPAATQDLVLPRNQIVVVGKLIGQDDPRQLTLLINNHTFPLEGGGNAKPFELIRRSPQLLSVFFQLPTSENRPVAPSSLDLHPRGVDFRFLPTERSLISAIILEEVDYATLESELSAEDIQKATNSFRILPVKPESNTVEMICYNFAHPILRERAVRHALSFAVNREKIVRQFLLNRADVAHGPFEKESHFHASGLKDFDYNPKRALALLEEAGWRETNRERVRVRNEQPLRFRLLFQEGLLLQEQLVRQIKIDWNQIGIDVTPIPVSAVALNDSLRRGRFDAVLVKNRFEENATSLTNFFGDGSGKGSFSYVNSGFLHTANLSRKLQNEPGLRQVVFRMQVLLTGDQIATFLFHPWLTIHIINAVKFEDYLNQDGLPRPFHEWVIRRHP